MLPVYSNSKMGSKGDNRLRAACHGGGLTSYRTDPANTFVAQRFQSDVPETPDL